MTTTFCPHITSRSYTAQMDKFLPYFERELSYFQRYSPDFAKRYPRIAGRLAPVDGHGDDPHVERITGALTMLGARTRLQA